MRRTRLLLALCLLCGPAALIAQPATMDMSAALRQGFAEVSDWMTKTAALVPADKYGYKPAAGVRSVAQQIAHVADSYAYYCAIGTGKRVQWTDAVERGPLDKATLTAKLQQATDFCTAAYATASPPLMANIAHTNLHYGNLVTYLRMLGLTPPSS